ncbi:uncharacterized protein BO80DRAFT_424887 [Aspergillus ibericus CBS 121593]|uniref:Uncharacterized protein n=1 Tax=Aspergillus ibericus CBS 121593 TaxID=1448316 RepID=A0A395H0H0_9EURO|nr:hypothetical protein BO80DRAFT_424887 [Aspergillus ibericus CBS 121593]RAL01332.1 hypothetical protein BO80DRAFT_424887 [Aspergillus ibericus CBS 121593]
MAFYQNQNQTLIGHNALWWQPVLWNNFPHTSLTEYALRDLDYRNQCLQQNQRPIPRPIFQDAPEYLRTCPSHSLRAIKQLSRHGGPDLTDLRGYPPPGSLVYSLVPTESGFVEPGQVQMNPLKRKRADPMTYYHKPQSPFENFPVFHFNSPYPTERPVKIPRLNHQIPGLQHQHQRHQQQQQQQLLPQHLHQLHQHQQQRHLHQLHQHQHLHQLHQHHQHIQFYSPRIR